MSIPVIQIYGESFRAFNHNKMSWLKLAFAPFMLYVFGFFVILLAGMASGQPLHTGQAPLSFGVIFGQIVYFIFSIIASGSLYINGYRYGILNEGGDRWWLLQMNMRLVKLILYTILIVLIAMALVLVGGGLVFATHFAFHMVALDVFLGIVFAILGFYILIRLALIYPLVAIEKENPLRTSWNLLRGNVLSLIGLSLLIGLTIVGVMLLGGLAIFLVGLLLGFISPFLLFIPIVAGVVFFAYIWILNWAVMAKALSLVYLSFTKGEV